mmetsp:Transcript_81678/g.264639  ORF Transcript_81678/g.264639 Transcript_81678/m.264639 type:complete len:250 (+) Transcript_81678:934-1683(+)
MRDEHQDDEELQQGQALVGDRHAHLQAPEQTGGLHHARQLQQSQEPDGLHGLYLPHLLRPGQQAYELEGQDGDDIDEEPAPQVVRDDLMVAVLQDVAVVGLVVVHEEELEDHVPEEEEVHDEVEEEEEVQARLRHGDLHGGHDRHEGQGNDGHLVPMQQEPAVLRVDDPFGGAGDAHVRGLQGLVQREPGPRGRLPPLEVELAAVARGLVGPVAPLCEDGHRSRAACRVCVLVGLAREPRAGRVFPVST